MLPDWCKPFVKPLLAKLPGGAVPAARHVAGTHDPIVTTATHPHAHIGVGHATHQAHHTGYSYMVHNAATHKAAIYHIPLWAKKAGVIAAACATPPLVMAALAMPPKQPADPGPFKHPGLSPAAPQAVPEPSGLLLMPLGVAAIAMLRRKQSKPAA